MKKFLFNFLFLTLAAGLTGCSVYRSEGRKSLEENARTLSNKEFLVEWKCEPDQYWEQDGQLYCVARPSTGSDASN